MLDQYQRIGRRAFDAQLMPLPLDCPSLSVAHAPQIEQFAWPHSPIVPNFRYTCGSTTPTMNRVLVSDPIPEIGLKPLVDAGIPYDLRVGMTPSELIEAVREYSALMVRSETKVTAPVIEAGANLKIIGRAGVGVDNIDVEAATQRGIVVVNSPGGNTVAAAELTMALLLSLARLVPQADRSLRSGEWKRSKFVGVELYKKTIGIVGFGKIGREVARRARAFGMRVLAFDPFMPVETIEQAGVEAASLERLFAESDFVTLHTPLNDQTRQMINAETLAKMKPGARIVNASRGAMIDEEALATAIESGHIGGAALDVFSTEPPPQDLKLARMEQTVVTPHLGASTEEAQTAVALDVSEQIANVLQGLPPSSPVNMVAVDADAMARAQPYLRLTEQIGKLHAQLASSPVTGVVAELYGDWNGLPTEMIVRASIAGLLTPMLSQPVNLVNAHLIAHDRGIRTETRLIESDDPPTVTITASTLDDSRSISGASYGVGGIRITEVDGLRVDLQPEGLFIFTQHQDQPGVIGSVGTLLGESGVNIAQMYVGREHRGSRAIMAFKIDDPVDEAVLNRLRSLDGVQTAILVEL